MTALLEIALGNAVVAAISALIVWCLSCVCRRPALSRFHWISTATRTILLATCLLPLWPAIGQDEQGNVTDARLESASAKERDANENFRGVTPTSIEPTIWENAPDIQWSASFSPDGTKLATSGGHWTRGGIVSIWDVRTHERILFIREPRGTRNVAFSPDGKWIATGNYRQEATIRNAETGEIKFTLFGHTGSINCVAFTQDGKTVATASQDKTTRLWDAATGKHIGTLEGHLDRVYWAVFTRDGETLLSASKDMTAKLWNVEKRELIKTLNHPHIVEQAVFSHDEKQIATACWDRSLRLWNVANGMIVATMQGHTSQIVSVSYSPAGNQIVTGDVRGGMRFWETKSHRLLAAHRAHERNIYSTVFSPDGRLLATASWDMTAKLWDVATRREIATFK